MGLFIQALAVGVAGAALLGFAYWGILVLLQPLLDQLRVLVHGRPVVAIPAPQISVPPISAAAIPAPMTPSPTGWMSLIPAPTIDIVANLKAQSLVKLLGHWRLSDPDELSVQNSMRAMITLRGVSQEPCPVGNIKAGLPNVLFDANCLDIESLGRTLFDRSLIIEGPVSGRQVVYLGSGCVSVEQKKQSSLREHPELLGVMHSLGVNPELYGNPEDDPAMSKLRMAKFSRPPAVSS